MDNDQTAVLRRYLPDEEIVSAASGRGIEGGGGLFTYVDGFCLRSHYQSPATQGNAGQRFATTTTQPTAAAISVSAFEGSAATFYFLYHLPPSIATNYKPVKAKAVRAPACFCNTLQPINFYYCKS